MASFEDILTSFRLSDIGFKRPRFTWSNDNLSQMIHKMVANDHWKLIFKFASLINLPLPSSTNTWVLRDEWVSNVVRFSTHITSWNRNVFGNIFLKKKRLLNRLQGIQSKLLEDSNPFLTNLRASLWDEYVQILDHEETYWFYMSRSKWLALGDRNTHFFHQSATVHKNKNQIDALKSDNCQWIYDEDALQSLAYMMKLARSLLSRLEALCVQVLKAKYRIGTGSMPSIRVMQSDSMLWKDIAKTWESVSLSICWIMGDVHHTKFWQDSFIPVVGPLISIVTGNVPSWQLHLPSVFFVLEGNWNWPMFSEFIPQSILSRISSINPPSSSGGSDFPAWKYCPNGEFSIKSTYELLINDNLNQHCVDMDFVNIWKWQGPPRVTTFTWKLIHGHILTNCERVRRAWD
ncbi:Reverse transcriptase zinc-binding domain [Sesbania bispinosa]|nr:Reverse transcriptase zinc-binding domain [Sesbania bispinosa]